MIVEYPFIYYYYDVTPNFKQINIEDLFTRATARAEQFSSKKICVHRKRKWRADPIPYSVSFQALRGVGLQ